MLGLYTAYWSKALTTGVVTNYSFTIHMDRRIYKLQRIGRRHEFLVLLWSGFRMTVKSHVYMFLQAQTFLSLESPDCAFLLKAQTCSEIIF